MNDNTQNVLSMQNVIMQFGGVRAIDNLSLDVNKGEIVALIGPNGAGKTTAFNCITGIYTPTSGMVSFNGKNLKGTSPDEITKLGIARTFQNIRLFSNLTVFDNVLIAKHLRAKDNVFTATLRLNRAEEKRMREETALLLKEQGLYELKDEIASSLPYGLQRHLEIARALATQPELLLLDEPAAGMNPQETQELTDFIVKIRDQYKLSIFMIEHHMDLVMQISERIYVLNFGKLIAQGTPDEIQSNPEVIEAYLGGSEDA
ncbi:amino acid/amide ABC transporter ATP-binding protein 1, HAAT family [Oribacterium sp. KHPX15]|uniref:ABC transporter ATP-binding protein n=1 Tax=Oribacterium sp. KHPX15 TaxID=1855342 RepID=UPI00089AC745|nr:ABC transporter ATP-binding protein [Oribacterium sp. KHPX15]SDZ82846.1 amino acid/amide ABC transporter ATP-binding protein 1, HAAT family [Oribacterium sp. KHPX15]